MTTLKYIDSRNPLNRVAPLILAALKKAQEDRFEEVFSSAAHLLEQCLDALSISVAVPDEFVDLAPAYLGDEHFGKLAKKLDTLLFEAGIPEQGRRHHARGLAERIHLTRAFSDPDQVLDRVARKVVEVVERFPSEASDIERGRNPGDVLDPFILAANQILLFDGSFTEAIGATVSHKALMMIEGLMGHLHEDVIAEMRGNVRAPEPRGYNQEDIDLLENPFPGADVVQPPLQEGETVRFFQVKSKTGSAKGGDGKRLGEQLARLKRYYRGEIFYTAVVGNTLRGHRSRKGVEHAAPGVVVLVGQSALLELSRSPIGPELLLRLYQGAFQQAATRTGYSLPKMTAAIVGAFESKVDEYDDDFIEVVLRESITGPSVDQDSRLQ